MLCPASMSPLPGLTWQSLSKLLLAPAWHICCCPQHRQHCSEAVQAAPMHRKKGKKEGRTAARDLNPVPPAAEVFLCYAGRFWLWLGFREQLYNSWEGGREGVLVAHFGSRFCCVFSDTCAELNS